MNQGKIFENSFKASIPDSNFYLRLKDSPATWGTVNEKARFTPSNACDCILHFEGVLFLAELKSHKGKSIPFSCFRDNQLKELAKVSCRKDEVAIAIFNFRDVAETYIVFMDNVIEFIETNNLTGNRKSIPLEWCRQIGMPMNQTLKKVNYSYAVEPAFKHLIFNVLNNQ